MSSRSLVTSSSPAPVSLRLADSGDLSERWSQLHDEIARRAFDLYERDGYTDGRDLFHWLEAEQEKLHPVHVSVQESSDAVTVRAEVPGFTADELQVSLESRRLTIAGSKRSSAERRKGETVYEERCSSEILRTVDLPAEVNAEKAAATLSNGVIELVMPKTTEAKKVAVKAAGA